MVCQKLLSFLNNNPKKENGKHTHIIYSPSPGKSYTIPNDKNNELYKLLHNSLFVKKDKISIVERIQDKCRLVIDLDFKYKDKISIRQYDENVLDNIIKNFFSNIENLYEL